MLGGSVGEMHAKKIVSVYDMAMKMGRSCHRLVDCAGIRLQEATDALEAFGQLYLKQTMASGVVPQVTAIFGSCGGGLAALAALTDFTFMEEKNAKLFVNSPNAIRAIQSRNATQPPRNSRVSPRVLWMRWDRGGDPLRHPLSDLHAAVQQ